jgi:hypothetical protein
MDIAIVITMVCFVLIGYTAGRMHGLSNERIEVQKVFDAWAESDKALFNKFTSFFLSTHKRD